jgi:XTP/dITP diphosphohydrolase
MYVTGNPIKFRQAATVCNKKGLTLTQVELPIHEIQAATGEPIARDKAEKAFQLLGAPVVVSDDSWMIAGLNSFPGPYMKYINDWFTPEDWLRLTSTLVDRNVTLRQIVVYQDAHIQKLFSVDIPAILLSDIRGKSPYAHSTIVSYDGGQTSNAEHHEQGKSAAEDLHGAWHEFVAWYLKRNTHKTL